MTRTLLTGGVITSLMLTPIAAILAACGGGSEPASSVASALTVTPTAITGPTASASSSMPGPGMHSSTAQAASGDIAHLPTGTGAALASASASASDSASTTGDTQSPLALAPVYNIASSQATLASVERRDAAFEPVTLSFFPSVGNPSAPVGQALTVQRSGWLSRVEIFLQSCSPMQTALRIDLRRTTSVGAPVAAAGNVPALALPMGTTEACGSPTGQGYWASVAFEPAPVPVQAGEVLSLWPVAGTTNAYRWPGAAAGALQLPFSHALESEQQFNAGYAVAYRTFVILDAK